MKTIMAFALGCACLLAATATAEAHGRNRVRYFYSPVVTTYHHVGWNDCAPFVHHSVMHHPIVHQPTVLHQPIVQQPIVQQQPVVWYHQPVVHHQSFYPMDNVYYYQDFQPRRGGMGGLRGYFSNYDEVIPGVGYRTPWRDRVWGW